ncbi:hypothetical protein QP868_02345 [Brevibacterium sp. UMB1308A]|nr:hypothetical protein [Brevibacterium sp. UMB1308A]MDK8712739.1 hypothetical protein [Brevibacterium sp. UMB1308A]
MTKPHIRATGPGMGALSPVDPSQIMIPDDDWVAASKSHSGRSGAYS